MKDINIRTVLDICPAPRKTELQVITRGATASLDFPLFNKVYGMDNIEQVTFSFKQGKKLTWFDMIHYYKLTEDTFAVVNKSYYERVERTNNSHLNSLYEFIKVNVELGASVVGLYEECALTDKEVSDNWQFDDHFSYDEAAGYGYIEFVFRSEETKALELTTPDNNMLFEVAIRLDTDSLDGMNGKDSVIITPQPSIAVVDSLYSKI